MSIPPRNLSKSKLSMFLRTQCDRELYLSMFSGDAVDIAGAGFPAPLKSRNNVQLVKDQGRQFEKEQYQVLATRLGPHARYSPSFGDLDFRAVLPTIVSTSLCLQPAIEPQHFRKLMLANLGVAAADEAIIPKISGMRPDIILVDTASPGDWEVTPTGGRKLVVGGDERQSLSVIDLKNVTEGNASYAAEVCLYAVALSNWLVNEALEKKYYVSERTYLWTKPNLGEFETLFKKNPTASKPDLIHALMRDLERESVDFLQFVPSVKRFFVEDVPRVIRLGDTHGWKAVDYHVGGKCNACDWLGHKDWLSPADLKLLTANPDRYCIPAAKSSGHLSQVANMSRGARRVLEGNGTSDVIGLTALPSTSSALSQHSFLKRHRNGLASKASALLSNTSTAAPSSKLNSIAKNVELRASVVVTFDPSAGRLTGVGLRADFLPPWGSTAPLTQLKNQGHMVERDTDDAEWMVLSKFIDDLVASAKDAAKLLNPADPKLPYAQIYFWEFRQYEELCKAFGRHLPRVLGLKDAKQRAVAWLFPADDLLERDDGAISPAIVFVRDLVELTMHLPVAHVYTMLRTAKEFSHPSLPPVKADSFYSEPLSNGIPRERTFEIWTNTSGVVEWGATFKLSLSDAVSRYNGHLRAMAYSLTSIVARIRHDFTSSIAGKAKRLDLSGMGVSQSLAFDSNMWFRWAALDHATASTKAGASLAAPLEELESRYESVVLDKMVKPLGGRRYAYKVSPDSLEAKIDAPNGYLTLGVESRPGFPLESGYSLKLLSINPLLEAKYLRMGMHRIIRAQLLTFDRSTGIAEVEFGASYPAVQEVFEAAMDPSIVDLAAQRLYLLEGAPYNATKETFEVLEAIGDPVNAKPDVNAIRALGKAGKAIAAGTDAPSTQSRLLWDAATVAKTVIRTAAAATALAKDAQALASPPLNASQFDAIEGSAKFALSLIWGPPGTGKTNTLAALVVAVVREATTAKHGTKILLTGPNYRAVEVLADRVLDLLAADASAKCDFFRAYSKSREIPIPPPLPAHVGGTNVSLHPSAPGYGQMASSLGDVSRITVIATSAHASRKVAELVDPFNTLVSAFDLVIIDESSQVPVTLALLPMATLKPAGQLIVAGDWKQMPPIASLDPPVGAEYLVGSIHTYFRERFNLHELPLLTNYRSNQDIVDYALTLDYPPNLHAANPTLRMHELVPLSLTLKSTPSSLPTSAAWEILLDPAKPVCALIHEDNVASQANLQEAKMVAAMVWAIFRSMSGQLDPLAPGKKHELATEAELFGKVVGIVTPHKAQRALILGELQGLFPGLAREVIAQAIDTVEKFQGGERQAIIVSFGVGDVDIIEGEEFFLLQLERINVSVSRAKAKCIVVMPKSLAYHLPSERKTLKTAKAIKSYLESFCSERQSLAVNLPGGATRAVELRWHK